MKCNIIKSNQWKFIRNSHILYNNWTFALSIFLLQRDIFLFDTKISISAPRKNKMYTKETTEADGVDFPVQRHCITSTMIVYAVTERHPDDKMMCFSNLCFGIEWIEEESISALFRYFYDHSVSKCRWMWCRRWVCSVCVVSICVCVCLNVWLDQKWTLCNIVVWPLALTQRMDFLWSKLQCYYIIWFALCTRLWHLYTYIYIYDINFALARLLFMCVAFDMSA